MDIMIKAALVAVVLVILNGSHNVHGQSEADVRLVDGRTNTSGRVEIFHQGQWGTICDDRFDINAATVVCNQLGYGDMGPLLWNHVPRGSGVIWLDDVRCNGDEWTLADCRHPPWSRHDCWHGEDVGVECDGRSFVEDLRLVGPTQQSGRLEVRWGGQWGPVCAYGFGNSEALVACKTLGFEVNRALSTDDLHGRSNNSIQLTRVSCTGRESSLEECSFTGPFDVADSCYNDRQVAINCFDVQNGIPTNLHTRINGGSAISGRLEFSINDVWGTVCGQNFNDDAAKVACRMLGLPSDYALAYSFKITQPEEASIPKPIWLNDVRCNGSEVNLQDCAHSEWGTPNCAHEDDVGVFCAADAHAAHHHQIRLAGSNTTNSGRIEVEYYGIWGTVCDDEWSYTNTKVTCRSLHLPYENALSRETSSYGTGSGPSWLDNVNCVGDELTLFDCPHERFGREDCQHFEDVAVICEW